MSEADEGVQDTRGLQQATLFTTICPIIQSAESGWLERLQSISDPRQLVIEFVMATDAVQIDELIPILVSRQGPAPLAELPTRTKNCLLRAGVETWEQVRRLDLRTIGDFKHAGDKTLRAVIDWCLRHAEEIARSGTAALNPSPGVTDEKVGQQDDASGTSSPVGRAAPTPAPTAIDTLRRWLAITGPQQPTMKELLELLASDLELLPVEVTQAAVELLSQPLHVGEADDSPDTADPLAAARALIGDDRNWEVWKARNFFGADAQPTFADIGEEFDLTRERVRQLDRRVTETMAAAIEADQGFESIRWRAHRLGQQLGSGVPLASSLATLALSDQSEEHAVALWHAGPYVQRDGWLVRKGESPKSVVEAAIRDLPGPLIHKDELEGILGAAGVPVAALDNVISCTDAIRDIGQGCLVRWYGAIPDKVEVVLALLGRPATAEEILEHFLSDRSVTSVKNALAADDRFYRTNMTEWALAEWGLEEYSGIVEEIIERIERDGGTTDTAALVEELVGQFGVSENSVRSYLGTPAFVVEGTHVRQRRLEEFKLKPKPLRHTRGVFRPSPIRLVANFLVDRDLLRGSGQAIDIGLATQLGLGPGGRLIFTSSHQEVRFGWRPWSVTGPDVGSLAPAARAFGAHQGDLLIVDLDLDKEEAAFGLVDESLQGHERFEALTGLVEPPDMVAALAAAIGVEPAEVRASLRNRGDEELIGLLPRQPDAALETQLDRLADFLDEL
ncbi:hypothetical protein [Candidatus Poriferisodalis sp.]|uniref:hypothetical protein n=1 Tax=Candidatus Poriferisodalis sp. TaxID=3101277 RepID=UPI003B016863